MNIISLAHSHTEPIDTTEGHPPAWLALATAIIMFVLAAACAPWFPGWATDYGAILVYWALALHLAIAIGLARWAVRAWLADYRSHTGTAHRTDIADDQGVPRR